MTHDKQSESAPGDSPVSTIDQYKGKLPRRVRRAMESRRKPRIYYTLGPKGGIGKSFTCRALIDLLSTTDHGIRIVQVDKGTLLPDLYPETTVVVHVPSADGMRADPLAAIVAFAPLEVALEACIDDGADLVVDVGAALNARMFLEFLAKARFDAYLAGLGIRPIALLLMTADPSAMSQSADLTAILAAVHPSAEVFVALNERDGHFHFRAGTQAHRVWTEQVEPLLAEGHQIAVPAMATGTWPYFEGHGLTFREIVEADERALAKRIGESRAITATLQGDVSEWIEVVWTALTQVVIEKTGASDVQ